MTAAIPLPKLGLLLSMSILTFITASVGLIGLMASSTLPVPRIKVRPITAEEYLLNEALTSEFEGCEAKWQCPRQLDSYTFDNE